MKEEIKNIIVCPKCNGKLSLQKNELACLKCKHTYRIINKIPVFLDNLSYDEGSEESFRGKLKKYPSFFGIFEKIHLVLGPPNSNYSKKYCFMNEKIDFPLKSIIKGDELILNIGSSSKKTHSKAINLDIGLFNNVDVVADGHGKVGDLRIYINPMIIWKSIKETEWYEGCYSTNRVCGIVSRPAKIKIKAYTTEGKSVKETHEGYIARIFQHEIDHLNGKEFVSHITDDEKLHWVEENEFPQYRDHEGWRNWPVNCPREKWEKIKGIRR